MKPVSIVHGQNAELLTVEAGGMLGYTGLYFFLQFYILTVL
jgi:hypothetical protein